MTDWVEAVLASSAQRVAVIAGPGAGKTHLLLAKLRQVLERPGVEASEVLVLVCSATEQQRFIRATRTPMQPVVATVASYARDLLCLEARRALRRRVAHVVFEFQKDVLAADLELTFPEVRRDDLRAELVRLCAGWAAQPFDRIFLENDWQRRFKAAVMEWLEEFAAAMPEEILHHAVVHARKKTAFRRVKRPRFVFVDDYQHLGRLAQEFIELVAAQAEFLFVTGDPDQSVCGSMLADPEGILRFATAEGVAFHHVIQSRRCAGAIMDLANRLLVDGDTGRKQFLQTARNERGEVRILRASTQEEEFRLVLTSIAERLARGASLQDFLVLAPDSRLGLAFVAFAEKQTAVGIPGELAFTFFGEADRSIEERQALVQFGLAAHPRSTLYLRTYLGLGDKVAFLPEILELLKRFGWWTTLVARARPSHYAKATMRLAEVARRCEALRVLRREFAGCDLGQTIDRIFPPDMKDLEPLRRTVLALREPGDDRASLFRKVAEHLRPPNDAPDVIRVSSLLESTGLEADHVYIIGCTADNLPGWKRPLHPTKEAHRAERRRQFYVGCTRARKSLTLSWAEWVPRVLGKNRKRRDADRMVNGVRHRATQMSEFVAGLPTVDPVR
jgi:superfamily I DNA/RNA helicase